MTRTAIVKRIALLALTLVTLYLVAPSLVEVFSSWPQLQKVEPGWLALMVALLAGSLACQWVLLRIAMHRPPWFPVVTSQLASNAFGKIVPGGGAAGAALQFQMLRDGGVAGASVITGVTAVNLLTFATLLGLPLLSLPAILDGVRVDPGLVRALWVAAIALVLLFAAGAVLMATDRPLGSIGRQVQRIRNRLLPRREPVRGLAERLIGERNLIRRVLGRRWKEALLASAGRWTLDFGMLLVALHAVGSSAPTALVLLAYTAANVLAQIPITPGGLGFVEAGLTAMLVLAGVGPGAAVLATLAYRLVSYWLPLPIGLAAWGVHKREYAQGVPAPAESGTG